MDDKLFKQCQANLREIWGYDLFRTGQEEVIRSVLDGNDTLVLFPTGGGKSLCYQIPATVFDGLTLVISPLVALMEDQVQQLKARGVTATFINSTLSGWEIEQRLANARNGMYKLLYCAPERLKSTLWKAELPKLDIDQVAIDEAHCISEWGHDFRPSYREIRSSLESIADSAAWTALTATATPEVKEDILENLGFEDPRIVSRGFERPNLKWWVISSEKKREKLLKSVKRASRQGTGLIYGGTRRNCRDLAELIRERLNINAEAYHAGIDPERRKQIQEEWTAGDLPLVVATSAFGMGIDKQDCRYVIHYQMPYTLESYYQEAGRAGRDGEESFPILLFKSSDAAVARQRLETSYPDKKQLQKVYDVLCDELDLAVGSGMESACQVSIDALVKRTQLSKQVLKGGVKVLDQFDVIDLYENMTPRIGVQFTVNADYLQQKVKDYDNRDKARFLDTLLRQFGRNAFAGMEYLDLNYLKDKLNTSWNGVVKGLNVMQDYDHLLNYEVLGESPLVQLRHERSSRMPVEVNKLERHRENLFTKLDRILGYVKTESCREVYIRKYFGEQDPEPCGHCDNCLENRFPGDARVDKKDVNKLKEVLSEEGKNIGQIQKETQWEREKVKHSLSFLMREEKVKEKGEKYYLRSEK